MEHYDKSRMTWALQSDEERALLERHLLTCPKCLSVRREIQYEWDWQVFHQPGPLPRRRVWTRIGQQLGWISSRRSHRLASAAALVIALGLGFWGGQRLPAPLIKGVAASPMLLKNSQGQVLGRLAVDDQGGASWTLTATRLPTLPSGQIYEVWRVTREGSKPLGRFRVTSGHARFVGRGIVQAGEEIVVCREPKRWANRWMGTVVLSGVMPPHPG